MVTNLINVCVSVKGKGKAVPLQAWSGPEGSRNLRFQDFMITAQDGGKVVSLTHRVFKCSPVNQTEQLLFRDNSFLMLFIVKFLQMFCQLLVCYSRTSLKDIA